MFEIKYQIGLNEKGRPVILLDEKNDVNVEDKFMYLEVTTYLISEVLNLRKKRIGDVEDDFYKTLKSTHISLSRISDEVAYILLETMKKNGEIYLMMNPNFTLVFDTIKERDLFEYVLIDDKIFTKFNGIKVNVAENSKTYELINDNWVEINKIENNEK